MWYQILIYFLPFIPVSSEDYKCYMYIEGLFIESWSGSSGYSTEMLTEGAQSWRVEDESTWTPSVNIEVEYLELSEYDEIEWPDSPTILL